MKTKEEVDRLFYKEHRDFRIRTACWVGVLVLAFLTVLICFCARYWREPFEWSRTVSLMVFGWGWGFVLSQVFIKIDKIYIRKIEELRRSVRSDYVAMISGKEAK